jgi:hypothetical protein
VILSVFCYNSDSFSILSRLQLLAFSFKNIMYAISKKHYILCKLFGVLEEDNANKKERHIVVVLNRACIF